MYLVLRGEVDDGVLRRRLAALFLRREEARRVEVLRVGLGRRGRLVGSSLEIKFWELEETQASKAWSRCETETGGGHL